MCNDAGWYSLNVPVGHPKFGKLLRCQCRSQEDAQRMQDICGLTSAELKASLDDITAKPRTDTARMVEQARRFIELPVGMFTIYGKCGNAKTVVLQAIVNACLAQRVSAIYTTLYDLVGYVREAYQPDATNSAWYRMHRLQDVPVLCVDELDKIKASDWVREVETQLFDTRYRHGIAGECGTVLAMNGDIEDLPEHLLSRLRDGRNVIVRNNDRDMRPLMSR
jgi:DNA replication protein DnaC